MNKQKVISQTQSIIMLKCPKCRKGNLFIKRGLFSFNKVLNMPKKCPVCGQVYEIEPGFWIGALWTSYPLVICIEIPFLMLALFSKSISPCFWFGCMLLAFFIFYPVMLRLGRSIWIHIAIRYDPKTKNLN